MGRKNRNKGYEQAPYSDYVPYEKSSKKEKRQRDRERRNDWGGLNPATRVVPNKRKEKRRKDDYYDREDYDYDY